MVIITKSYNNYCSVRVMELRLLNLLILIDCFWCNSRSFFEILKSPEWKFQNFKISKFQKSEFGKSILNFPLKHVIISTNCYLGKTNLKKFRQKAEYCFLKKSQIFNILMLNSFIQFLKNSHLFKKHNFQ